jgi:hypothetical protein
LNINSVKVLLRTTGGGEARRQLSDSFPACTGSKFDPQHPQKEKKAMKVKDIPQNMKYRGGIAN